MAVKPLNSIWIRRQQCPCGDWKCYIKYEGDDQAVVGPSIEIKETTPPPINELAFTPYVGQIFKSDDEAFEFYSNFARKSGFSIRKARSSESQNLGVYRRDFVCYRSGYNQPRKKANVEHSRDRKSVRCGCDAKLYTTKEVVNGQTQWYISQFSNIHNHELLEDDQVRLLPAYRKIEEADQEHILLLSKAGFSVNRILKVLELEKGVQPGQLPFIEKDVRNFVRTCRKSVQECDAILNEKRENDLLELLDTCKAMAQKNDDFVYSYTSDELGKVENIAWAYGTSVRAFSVFGDVVTFDTSYRSVALNVLLGVWFCLNNHGRPVFLGCVLLQDETSQSFSWALQVFKQFMRGHPQTIVTDIDSGLRDAVAMEMPLPNTKHIVSIWQVLPNFSSWFSLPLGTQFSDFKTQFEVLYDLEDVEEFEHQLNHLIARFGLGSDKHIALLYNYRSSWSFCYIRNFFLGHSLSSEYLKLVETIMTNMVGTQTCLQSFFGQVGIVANGFPNKEHLLYVPIKTCMPLEEHARTILTPYAFHVAQNEIMLSMQYALTEMPNGSFRVRHYKKMERECLVYWIPEVEQLHCSCKKFEHSGILCRHSVRVLVLKNYFQIPEKYLPWRWQLASSLIPPDDHTIQIHDSETSHNFHALIAGLFAESSVSKERRGYVHRGLTELLEQVQNLPVPDESAAPIAPNNVSES